jgi:fermentation-respiration switch protein FrsA (DUF1100 family)
MRTVRTILLMLVVLACGIGGTLYSVETHLVLYHPDVRLPSPAQAGVPEMRPVTIHTKDNLPLTSWFVDAADDKPVLLFFMGDTGSLADRADAFKPFIQHGYGIFLLGYRGFGGNPGEPSERGLYRDARAAIAWLGSHGYDAGRIVLYGHSLGTGIAVQMATEIKARAVILEAPYTTLPDTVQLNMPLVSANWFMKKDYYNNIEKIGKIREPLLIVQGDHDEVIPYKQGKALFKAAPEPKQAYLIPEGGHSDLFDYGEAQLVMDFLDHHAGEGSEASDRLEVIEH